MAIWNTALVSCDLLENSYLCGINNNNITYPPFNISCDLLENSYLCGINNNILITSIDLFNVVICLKIRTFVVSTTTQSTV